jgi:hypothetical protein
MQFEEVLDQAIAMLQRRGRVTYRALKRQSDSDGPGTGGQRRLQDQRTRPQASSPICA